MRGSGCVLECAPCTGTCMLAALPVSGQLSAAWGAATGWLAGWYAVRQSGGRVGKGIVLEVGKGLGHGNPCLNLKGKLATERPAGCA